MTTICVKPQHNPPKFAIKFKILTVRFCNCQHLINVIAIKRTLKLKLHDTDIMTQEPQKRQLPASKPIGAPP